MYTLYVILFRSTCCPILDVPIHQSQGSAVTWRWLAVLLSPCGPAPRAKATKLCVYNVYTLYVCMIFQFHAHLYIHVPICTCIKDNTPPFPSFFLLPLLFPLSLFSISLHPHPLPISPSLTHTPSICMYFYPLCM